MLPHQVFKENQASTLPAGIGVYALCDLEQVPIYVGQSTDGIRARVRRHLTSARSDVIANRQVDVWEVAYVWAWEMPKETPAADLDLLEAHFFHEFDAVSPLVNGDVPKKPDTPPLVIPAKVQVQVISDEEIKARREPVLRFPRQIQHFNQLVDYILNTQDKPHLRRALKVYFERLSRYYKAFLGE